jgi:putative phosphoesterase
MKIAVFADIQGNAIALEAALNDMRRHQPDRRICLGDVVTGAQPVRCLQLLREANCRVVQGNMDAAVLNLSAYDGDDDDERRYSEIDQWCYAQLSAEDRRYLADLPAQLALDTPFGRLLCVHGSPRSFDDMIDAATSESQLATMLTDCEADVLAVGHMHTPLLRRFGSMKIVNPGSVGLPYGARRPMPCRAQYAIVQAGAAQFYSVNYEVSAMKRGLLNSAMPHRDWFAARWQL